MDAVEDHGSTSVDRHRRETGSRDCIAKQSIDGSSHNLLTKKMLDFLNPLLGRHPEQMKANVEIYTWQTCPFCIRAKMLLWWKGVKFTEYKIDGDEAARQKMAERANGRRTVPQIFINNEHVGGCDDLYELDAKRQLDPLLVQPAN